MFLVVYDMDGHIPTRFYDRLRSLFESGLARRVQKSVLVVYSKSAIEEIVGLVEKYRGSVKVFKIAEEVVVR